MISTDSTPHTAAMNRQPNASLSKILMPSAMIHLPSGGCTTKSPYELRTLPAESVSVRHSTPWSSSSWPSVA